MVQIEGVIEYTDRQLEEMAHNYHRTRPDVQFRVPVNVGALLESHAHVEDLDVVPNLLLQTGHEGCVCKTEHGPGLIVYVDQNIADSGGEARYNAVLAEELAHIVLHKSIVIQIKSIDDFLAVQKSPHWNRMERDARYFSAALRMPFQNLVLKAESLYPAVVDEYGYGDSPVLEKLLRNALSEKFCVPGTDVQTRLMHWPCRIIERVRSSIQAKSPTLLPVEWLEPVRRKQSRMF